MFDDTDSAVLQPANDFFFLAILAIMEKLSKTTSDVTKYRGIPASRYFSDGILSSGISSQRASLEASLKCVCVTYVPVEIL